MKKTKNILLLICLIAFSQLVSSQKLIEGDAVIQQIERKYKVSLNYSPEDLKLVKVPKQILDKSSTLEELIFYIQHHYNIDFKEYKKGFYNLTLNAYDLCLHFINAIDENEVSNLKLKINGQLLEQTNAVGKVFLNEVKKINQLELLSTNFIVENPIDEIEAKSSCYRIYVLQPEVLDEVYISDYLTQGIQLKNNQGIEIKPKQFGSIPGLVNPDVFHSLQYVPGVLSPTESISEINTRGGTHDQNLILWNGVRMYQTGHFFGMISALNPFAANQIDIYKNGTESKYNEGISSVMDISSFSDFKDENTTLIHANFLGSSLVTSQQLSKHWRIDAALRLSLTNAFKSPTYKQFSDRVFQNTDVSIIEDESLITGDIDFHFQDLSFNAQYKPSAKDVFKMGVLGFENQLDFDKIDVPTNQRFPYLLSQENILGMLSWDRNWNESHTSKFQFSGSFHQVEASNVSVVSPQRVIQQNEVLDFKLQFQHFIELNRNQNFYLGYDFQEIGITNINQINFPSAETLEKNVLHIHSVYADWAWENFSKKIDLQLSLRTNYYDIINQILVEPRFNFNYNLNPRNRLFVMGELKHQSISKVLQQQEEFFGFEQGRWTLNNAANFKLARSRQFELGWQYKNGSWLLQSQIYYKKVNHINSKSQGFQNQFEFLNSLGNYTAYGWEAMLQKKWDKIRLWANFSYNNNTYNFNNFVPSVFPNNFEIHFTNASGISYQTEKFSFSLANRFYTGKPFTSIDQSNPITDIDVNPAINFNSPNQSNLPNYFQVNASADYTFKLGSYHLKCGASLLNIFNKKLRLDEYYDLNNEASSVLKRELFNLGTTPNFFATLYF